MFWWGHVFPKKKKKETQIEDNAVGWIFLCVSWTWPRCFHVLCQKNQRIAKAKSAASVRYLQNAVLHPALLNRKTSYLMQYLVSNTNMESVSSSRKKKKKKEKNINYRVYIYLTNVKGFFLFMCESCESKILFSFWFTVDILFICHCLEWMLEPCDLPCLCELCVCGVRVPVCWFVSLKQYEWWLYLWVEMLRNIN